MSFNEKLLNKREINISIHSKDCEYCQEIATVMRGMGSLAALNSITFVCHCVKLHGVGGYIDTIHKNKKKKEKAQ